MKQPPKYLPGRTPGKIGTCERCGAPLGPAPVLLELDQRINEYHDLGGVPGCESQGLFEFGPDCAAICRARAIPKLEALGPNR